MRMKHYSAVALAALSLVASRGLAEDNNILKGTVHNEDKKLVDNATVRLLHRNGDKLEEVDTTTTNGDGVFEFTKVHDGTYEIVALAGKRPQLRDRAEVTVNGRNRSDLDFTVRKGEEPADEKAAAKSTDLNVAKVKGNARFAANDFVKNGKVRLLAGHGTDYASMREISTTTTDSKGNFSFPGVQQGDYTIVVTLGKSEGTHKITINPKEKSEDVDILVK